MSKTVVTFQTTVVCMKGGQKTRTHSTRHEPARDGDFSLHFHDKASKSTAARIEKKAERKHHSRKRRDIKTKLKHGQEKKSSGQQC